MSAAWFAPGRLNLIGEHTDYNDGFVLPFALPQRTVVRGSVHGETQWTVTSSTYGETVGFGEDDLRPGRITGWAGYVAGVVWALREAGHAVPFARFSIDSDVPVGSGLSSSAALECAVLTALVDLGRLDLPTADRPRLAQRAENDYVGVPCGVMDQAAATLCRAGHALFLDCRTLDVAHIPFDVAAAGLAVLVIDTNAPHRHADNEYAERRRSCEAAARDLGLAALRDVTDLPAALAALPDPVTRRRVRHVVTENQRVRDVVARLRAGELDRIGPLLTASHESMRDDYEITVPEVDLAVTAALDAGALGARMTGGGFGGCVLALVAADTTDTVAHAVRVAFAGRGFTAPNTFIAEPGPGAGPL